MPYALKTNSLAPTSPTLTAAADEGLKPKSSCGGTTTLGTKGMAVVARVVAERLKGQAIPKNL